MIAHEYGHHVQDLLGTSARAQRSAQRRRARRGLGAAGAAGRLLRRGVGGERRDSGFLEDLTEADVRDGLSAAAAVGDDRIQRAATGRVDPSRGPTAPRLSGRSGSGPVWPAATPGSCDTFSGAL